MSGSDLRQRAFAFSPYENEGLFADNYLQSEHRLPALADWQEPDGLEEALSEIANLYEDRAASFTSQTNESQTEEYLIKPILRILGWEYEPQQPIAGVRRTPDYALLTSREEWEAIQELKGTPELWEHCTAVGDAKRWKQDLDRSRDGENPSIQITNYLFRSGVRWGILTNGAKWRLYEQDRSRGGGIYYEVDLLSILQSQDPEAFKYFYLFFRKDAFVPVRDEKSFVEIVYEGSERYRTEVGDSLKEAVYDALRHLMNGFFRYPDNELDPSDADQLKQVHDLSLVLLYRILFLLYAEDEDLLPASTQPYADYSMLRLQKEVNSHLRAGQPYAAGGRRLWSELLNRFDLIDQGRGIIPAYNGGLFSCARYPEIAYERQPEAPRWEIGDSYLAEAIDLLAYQRESWDEPGSQTVDYATLGVQHLGAIYEGLLELKPQVASEPMIEQPGKSGKPPVVKEKSDVEEPKKVKGQTPREFSAGEIYLVTDRGERKATGSYYTPKYIVDYIVEHTVGKLAAEAAQEVASRWEELAEELDISGPEQWPELLAAADQEYARRELEEKQRRLLEPYLDLKILDPAMGSGHFLVGASDHLSLAMATDAYLPPVPEAEEADVQAYYKRLVVEHCLYGVDLNPLAVELAKLSLWLHTVSRDKALSFLDHHLRCGNSLIGARLQEDLTRVPPPVGGGESKETVQTPLGFDETLEERDLAAFLDTFRKIVEAPTGDAETERDKDRWFTEMDHQRDRYRQVANLWLAAYFGVNVSAEQYSQALEGLREGAGSEEWQTLTEQDWFQQAQDVASERNFFHWELEFPEAFFEVQDSRAAWKPEDEQGFDAVIGNPPYVRASKGSERSYLQRTPALPLTYGRFDLYMVFIQQGLKLIHDLGWLSMIVPHPFLSQNYGEKLRRKIVEKYSLSAIVDMSGISVFDDAHVTSCIIVLGGPQRRTKHQSTRVIEPQHGEPSGSHFITVHEIDQRLFLQTLRHMYRIDITPKRHVMSERLWRVSVPASDLCYVGVGIDAHDPQTGDDKHARIRNHQVGSEYKPYVEGKDIERYSVVETGRYLEYIPERLHRPKYPEMFENPNILTRVVAGTRGMISTLDDQGHFAEQTLIVTLPKHVLAATGYKDTEALPHQLTMSKLHDLCYVLSLIESKLLNFQFECWLSDGLHVVPDNIRRLPIRTIDFEHPTRQADKEKLAQRCREAIEEADYVMPCELAREALATYALLHGPAGKPELKEDPYWQEQIAGADPDFPGREDFVHDLLAELAQRMIDLNNQKHQLIDKFETDLRGAAAEELHESLEKGKQGRSLYKHESCQPYVEEDSHSTHHLPESLAWSEAAFEDFLRELVGAVSNLTDFLEVYCRYTDQYRQATDALEKTDNLIDQIVYALYGLTEEEIAIVEGTAEQG